MLELEKRTKLLVQKKKYREKNKEKIRKYALEYYRLNKEKISLYRRTEEYKESRKKYRENNRKKILIKKKEYREKNKDKLNKQALDYYHKNMLDPEYRIKQKKRHLLYYKRNRKKRIEAVEKWRKNNPRKHRLSRIKSYLKSGINRSYEKW